MSTTIKKALGYALTNFEPGDPGVYWDRPTPDPNFDLHHGTTELTVDSFAAFLEAAGNRWGAD